MGLTDTYAYKTSYASYMGLPKPKKAAATGHHPGHLGAGLHGATMHLPSPGASAAVAVTSSDLPGTRPPPILVKLAIPMSGE